MPPTPDIRLRRLNDAAERDGADYILYWMVAARRFGWNFGLQRAVEAANRRRLPLVVFEPLRCDYRWASDRLHAFVMDGMREHAGAIAHRTGVRYVPYIERSPGEGRGLLSRLASRAALVVTDDWPCFFLPPMQNAAAARLDVRLEAVDGNGLLPLRAADRVFPTAHGFRRFLQRELGPHLSRLPAADPLAVLQADERPALPAGVADAWPLDPQELQAGAPDPATLPIDHAVSPVKGRTGGSAAARRRLHEFLVAGLPEYGERRNAPERDAASGLSPWLHFGHIGAAEVFAAVAARESWTADRLSDERGGARRGWWGLSEPAEAFLDQLVTWRELGLNRCALTDDYDRYESLPEWARETLEEHEGDEREHVYPLEAFDAAETHDPLWNAAQVQLRREGRIHNYLRMLWGKKILEWTRSPREALEAMIVLNDRYALDGRDPNSYSGIFWCLGRYDRAWGPERPIFGKIRYMSSANTRRKYSVDGYLTRWRP